MQTLLELNIIQYYQPPDGVDFTCILTPEFISRCEKLHKELAGKKFNWEDLLTQVAKENKIRLHGRLLSDVIQLMLFIDKWGKKGQIWIK